MNYTKKDILGFRLLIEYPGCRAKVGHIEPCTTGEFRNYPKIWEPIFTKQYIRDNKLEKLGIY